MYTIDKDGVFRQYGMFPTQMHGLFMVNEYMSAFLSVHKHEINWPVQIEVRSVKGLFELYSSRKAL